jgi:hypothetical protein
VPRHVESQRLNRVRVGQVMQLLQKQNAYNDVEIFRRSAEAIVKVTAEVGGRKSLQKVVPKNTGPGSLQ